MDGKTNMKMESNMKSRNEKIEMQRDKINASLWTKNVLYYNIFIRLLSRHKMK